MRVMNGTKFGALNGTVSHSRHCFKITCFLIIIINFRFTMVGKGMKIVRASSDTMEEAVVDVINNKLSIRCASEKHNISKSALHRAVKYARSLSNVENFQHKPDIGNRRIFKLEQEDALVQYLITASKMCYGIGHTGLRQLAYQYAKKLEISYPAKWDAESKAGLDWLKHFKARHKSLLSLRKPEKTSLSRATAFNPTNVNKFFNNLEQVMEKYKFSTSSIFNCDETGLLTVTDPPKVLCQRGTKQVGQATSAERGTLVTMLSFICANGHTIPPAFVFPRVGFRDFMLHGAPPGSLGLANKSGWMTENNFFLALQHFVKYTKPTKEEPILLTFDNHESHISLDVVNYAKSHHVVLLTFPPHCSHKLQPLDVSVYGPFKTYFKSAQNQWMLSNPGKTFDIYKIAAAANQAYLNAFTPKNIMAGFASTGIHPLNRHIFQESDFLSSFVTDHEAPSTSHNEAVSTPKRSIQSTSDENSKLVTPESVRPFPKAPERKEVQKGRKRGTTKILTDTPEVNILEEQHNAKLRKNNLKKSGKQCKRNILEESSDSDVEDFELQESDQSAMDCENESDIDTNELFTLKENDFILVDFSTKKNKISYIGCIKKTLGSCEFEVKFLRRFGNSNKFFYPAEDDISDVERGSILRKLRRPYTNLGTSRTQATLKFDIDFSTYEIKFGRIL